MSETTETLNTPVPPSTAPEAAAPAVEAAAEAPAKALPPLSEDDVREALEKVIDPELHMNIMELGLVYNVAVSHKENQKADVDVEMTLTSPGCPYGPVIMGQIPSVLKDTYPNEVDDVNVSLTFSPPWDPATMASEDVKFELGIF